MRRADSCGDTRSGFQPVPFTIGGDDLARELDSQIPSEIALVCTGNAGNTKSTTAEDERRVRMASWLG